MTGIIYGGDPHGDFGAILRAARDGNPEGIVLVGDMDPARPLAQEMAEWADKTWWVPGNHEADRQLWWANLFADGGAGCLHGRVVEVGGARVAGLGGVFLQAIWHPEVDGGRPRWRSREEWLAAHADGGGHLRPWRAPWEDEPGLPLSVRAAIWPEDYDALADTRADILVTHEPPTSHRYGHAEIDLLAEALGVGLVVHGHVHDHYEAELASGIRVAGVGKAMVWTPQAPIPRREP